MESHRVPHGLPLDLALLATRTALDSYKRRFPKVAPDGEWLSERHGRLWFDAAGKRLEGEIHVDEEAVELRLDVPLVFRPFRKKALEVIEAEIALWIDRARRGELHLPEVDDVTEEGGPQEG